MTFLKERCPLTNRIRNANLLSIFHAHNWTFDRVRSKLSDLRLAGFDAIQISPAQKSASGGEWYLRYQPVDHLIIDGLGNADQLAELCEAAAKCNMTVIADVVFNHMAVPTGLRRGDWEAAEQARVAGDQSAIKLLYTRLSEFPHLTVEDFQPWRDMQGDDWDNDFRYESWGNGEWPELKPTENVISLHKKHLEMLFANGVRGFRFDAVKHMRPEHMAKYIAIIDDFSEKCWAYGEVLSGDPIMHEEYHHLFPTTDFLFILFLKKLLQQQTEFVIDPEVAFLSQTSIRFGQNHDLILNPAELVSGLLFQDTRHTRLANCLSVLLAGGSSLVFADVFETDQLLQQCLLFRAATKGISGPVKVRKNACGFSIEGANQSLDLNLASEKLVT